MATFAVELCILEAPSEHVDPSDLAEILLEAEAVKHVRDRAEGHAGFSSFDRAKCRPRHPRALCHHARYCGAQVETPAPTIVDGCEATTVSVFATGSYLVTDVAPPGDVKM